MHHANNEYFEKGNNWWNRTAKSRKHQNAQREKNYKYIGILEADTIKQTEMIKK